MSSELPARGEYFEVARETGTMALYLAIVLLAELAALPEDVGDSAIVVSALWGTSIGLAIAHWFAFTLSTRLLWEGHETRTDRLAAAGQLGAAVVVAALASIPFVFGSGDAAFTAAGGVLAVLIGIAGARVARAAGASTARSIMFAVFVVGAAGVVVAVKAALSH